MPSMTRRHLRRAILKEMIRHECGCQDQEDTHARDGVKFHNNGPEEESGMIRSNLYTMSKQAQEIHDMIDMDDDLDEWVQEKIAVASSMLDSVYDYLSYEYMSMSGEDAAHDTHDSALLVDDMEEEDFNNEEYTHDEEEMVEPNVPLRQSTGIMFFEKALNEANRKKRR